MNKISFYPVEGISSLVNEYVSKPQRASSVIPDWYKYMPRYQNGEDKMISNESYHNLTVKHCMPFIESMTSGYFLTTWTDIYIKRENDDIIVSYGDQDVINYFGRGIINYQKYFQSNIPKQQGYDPFLYAWSVYWRISTPPGTSCIFTQPLNRTDLPFLTLSGIVDTDQWNGSDVLNFALSENFEGMIPKGTPYVQIIPFVRSDWNFEVLDKEHIEKIEERNKPIEMRLNCQSGYYRDNIWEKKQYI